MGLISRLGRFTLFIGLLAGSICSKADGAVLLDKKYVFSDPVFSFSNLNTVSFSISKSHNEIDVDLNAILQSVVGNQVKVVFSKKEDPVDVKTLQSKVQYFVLLIKAKDDLYLMTTNAVVSGTTFNGFKETIPIYGNTYLIQPEKKEIEDKLKSDLNEFFQLYLKTNSANLSKVVFYSET